MFLCCCSSWFSLQNRFRVVIMVIFQTRATHLTFCLLPVYRAGSPADSRVPHAESNTDADTRAELFTQSHSFLCKLGKKVMWGNHSVLFSCQRLDDVQSDWCCFRDLFYFFSNAPWCWILPIIRSGKKLHSPSVALLLYAKITTDTTLEQIVLLEQLSFMQILNDNRQ